MISNSRLYTLPTLTPEQWLEITPTKIPTRKLAYSQSFISLQVLWDMSLGRDVIPYGNDRIIHVVKENDIYWIHDGHHRFAYNLVTKVPVMDARIYNMDSTPVPKNPEDFLHADGRRYIDD